MKKYVVAYFKENKKCSTFVFMTRSIIPVDGKGLGYRFITMDVLDKNIYATENIDEAIAECQKMNAQEEEKASLYIDHKWHFEVYSTDKLKEIYCNAIDKL